MTVESRLKPAHHVEPLVEGVSGLWRSTGQDPNFWVLPPPGKKRHRGGWTRLICDLRLPTPADLAPYPAIDLATIDKSKLNPVLYVDDGNGFREDLCIALEVSNGGIDNLIRLPRRVRGLRFDPMNARGAFVLSGLRIRSLSLPAAVSEIARRMIAGLPESERAWRRYAPVALRYATRTKPARVWRTFFRSARPKPAPPSYKAWIDLIEAPNKPTTAAMRVGIAQFARRPLISIVMPVYDTPRVWLEAAVASVKAQAYENWELCLCDDHSSAPHIRPMLEAFVAGDPRIKLHRRTSNGRISAATNDAMALATGDYLTLMDHDDAIPDNALYEFARVLDEDDSVDFIYSDEDKVSIEGVRYEPFFKPDWSPEALEACMYTAHLALYRMDIVRKVGGFREACNGAQDYDFVLRYTEHVRNVRHVPKVLYHWRAIPGSTAQHMDNKDYVIDAAVRGLEDRARRTGELDFVRPGAYKGCFELRRKVRGTPLVSIVIPTAGRDSVIGGRSVDLAAACVESIRSLSTYGAIEIVAVDNGDLRPQTIEALAGHRVRTVTYGEPGFNVAAKMNLGARAATGEVLVFLNDDMAVITPDWIEAMLSVLQIDGVGAVGAKLLFETGQIQHAGVSVLHAGPDHIRRGYPGDDPGHFFSTVGNRNYLAVTGACMMVDRAEFERQGGFDERYAVNYNDIDLCLRIWEGGRRIVYCAQACLYHYESRNRARTVDPGELARFHERWRPVLPRDPYYGEWFEAMPPTFELDPVRF
ncbi:glycosyl transferase [Methylobacterium sp. Leaf399]|uniref:glycosyltransferase family 2 protein n=1 Tax=unclassified Methylobacterium TaxID=2615210 RepID=UPI0006F8EFF1|nr:MULTISPECIES: glycosyltransferase [unclassified Methylobacterium]KQT17207.1 glycosyl transferase [Methylobacterium sp. Leaf399]KQT77741.1 glycosyl transferase [Methylobacterium sp. Leaf466]